MGRVLTVSALPVGAWMCLTSGLLAQSSLGPRLSTIGVGDEPIEQAFGEVLDVEVDSLGRLYVLDGISKDIRVFDSSSNYLLTLGREGHGPSEFAGLITAASTFQGSLLIADAGNIRLTTISAGARPEVVGEVRVSVVPTGICTLGRRIFLWHNQGDYLVSETGSDGLEVRAFAAREKPVGVLGRMLQGHDHFLNQGSLACDESNDIVILAHMFHPVVRAFRPSGAEVWRVELSDYHQQQFRVTPTGLCCAYLIPDPKSNTYHVALEVVSPGDGFAYISLRESGPQTRDGDYEVRVIDLTDGQEVSRFSSPGILSAVSGGKAYVIEPYPIPKIHVHAWTPGG